MRLSFTRGAVAASLTFGLSVLPAVLSAQPGGVSAACSIDPNSPKELAILELQLQRAKGASTPADRQNALRSIMKELDTKPERFTKNPAGFQMRMVQALSLWAVEPGIGLNPTRSTLGFQTNPTATINLIQALDDSYKAMSAAQPACATDVNSLRQNEVWLAMTRRALDASNAGELDTADFYAKASLQLSSESPYPHYVMANVANSKKDKAAAMGHWKQVIKEAGADTTYRELKNNSMFLLSVNQLEAAEAASGAQQVALAKEASESFKALLAATPDSPDAPSLMASWADAMKLAGDSASVPSIYADMLTKPDGYSDIALTMGGVIATRNNKADDAIKLFDAAAKKNPAARDALRNLAATYYGKDQFKEMFAPSQQLVAIDPNNYDGWMMLAYAAQGLAKAAKLPAEKKAWNDTTVKYMGIAEALPVKVDVATFQRGASDVTLTLKFEQVAAADGNYDVTVEFLNAAGAVVGSANNKIGPIKKGESTSQAFKATAQGVAGYRYKALK